MDTFASVISLWGKAPALAVDIGEQPGTVRAWRNRNSIPSEKWLLIVDAAEKRGIKGVTLEVLAQIASGRPAGKGEAA